MKIAIDVSQIPYETGVSTYTKSLVKSLLSIDKQNKYILFAGYFRRKKYFENFFSEIKGNFEVKLIPYPPVAANLVWNKLHIVKIEMLVGKIDVFHSSDWAQPPGETKMVTTIHDLVPIKYPELSHPKIVSAHKARFEHVKNEVDKIIVPTKATANDLEELGIEASRIEVIPEAPDDIFKPVKQLEVQKLKRKYRISGDYLLAVGVNKRKNTEAIIKAYEKIKGERKLKLVIIGHPNTKLNQVRGIVSTGHVPYEELPVFYGGAKALVYPSLYEGYGLPIIEAFSCKTPVVTSDSGSMKEVAAGGAILVNPLDVDSIYKGIKKALDKKDELIKNGRQISKKLSWINTASKTLKVYSSLI